jgi:2-methylcitrate dehydratase PrpD
LASQETENAPVPVSPMMMRLSAYMAEARRQALPAEVSEKAKHHILDTVAAMISGSELPPGRAALRFAGDYTGKDSATVVASKLLCGPIEAALINGVLAHSDETDDSHGPSRAHPGAAVIPAALAAGEWFGISGAHFLRAVVLGYDVGTRSERYASEHARRRWDLLRGGRRGVCGRPRCAPDAPAARLRFAAIVRLWRLGP